MRQSFYGNGLKSLWLLGFPYASITELRPIVDVVEVNQRGCLEESEQWSENVDQTHLVLASGKLVLKQ